MRYAGFLFLLLFCCGCQNTDKPAIKSILPLAYTYHAPKLEHRFWKNGFVYREEASEALVELISIPDTLQEAPSLAFLFLDKACVLGYPATDSLRLQTSNLASQLVLRYLLYQQQALPISPSRNPGELIEALSEEYSGSVRLLAEQELFEPLGIDEYRWQKSQLILAESELAYVLYTLFQARQASDGVEYANALGFTTEIIQANGRRYHLCLIGNKDQLLGYCPEVGGIILLQSSILQDKTKRTQALALAVSSLARY